MKVLVVGASKGLGRAFVEGLTSDGHQVTGVSRVRPADSDPNWIEADFNDPRQAADTVALHAPGGLDLVIYNLGAWEPDAFTPDYDFVAQQDNTTESLIATNITGPILLLNRLLPRLLNSDQPRVILTGSTSGLPRSGRPEVAFGSTKAALNGLADALRENYRAERLAVTTIQLGYLNTADSLDVPKERAALAGEGLLVPVHDVLDVVRMILALSPASFIREIVMPAILDERF